MLDILGFIVVLVVCAFIYISLPNGWITNTVSGLIDKVKAKFNDVSRFK